MGVWDPATYLRFADERSRPFFDLLAQISTPTPSRVVDLGCGPGQLTAGLAERWPTAQVLGIDSSPQMIERAAAHAAERVRFRLDDLSTWEPDEPVDVIISNAALQWAPGHRRRLPALVDALTPGGTLAFQVPGNFDEPSHALLRELADDPRFAGQLSDIEHPAAYDAVDYLDDLARLGCSVNAWETTYLHVLSGPDPVFGWISGTGARPVLQALSDESRAEFVAEYSERLRAAYPRRTYGTLLPFRRIFLVARRPRSE